MPLQVDGTGGITKEGIPFLEDLLSIGKDDLLLLTAPYSSDPNSKNKMYRQFYEKEGLLFLYFQISDHSRSTRNGDAITKQGSFLPISILVASNPGGEAIMEERMELS